MSQFAQVLTALEPVKTACAWFVWAGYDARYATADAVEGPMEWPQAEARRTELHALMPGRPVTVLFDVGQLG